MLSPVKVNSNVERAIRRIIDSQPALYLDEIQNQLYLDTGVLISHYSIWRVMVNRLGWTHRVYQLDQGSALPFRQDTTKTALC